ncbi:hypothetical protein, partial [Faecalibacterium sp. An77]|uniref:hypothetical protein n=1 Tax=Faecalibacterium sp. An77 TaxID=1965655 RepID=UPI001951C55D
IAHFYPRETSEISKTFDTFSYFLTGQYFFTVGGLWSAYVQSRSPRLFLFKTTAYVVDPGHQILEQFRMLAEVHERDGIKWADVSLR